MFVVGIFTFVSTKFTWFEILPSNSTINHRSPSPGTWGIPSPGTNLRNSRDRGAFRETTNLLWGQVPIKFPQEFCNRRVFHFTKIVYFLRVVFEKTCENQMKGTTKKGWFVDVFPVSRKTCFLERQLAPSLMSDASLFFGSVPARKNGSIQWFGLGRKSLKSYWTLWTQVERRSDRHKRPWEPELHAEVTNSALLDMEDIPSISTIFLIFDYPTWRKISSNMLAVCVSLWHVSWKFPSYQNNFMQTNHAEVTWKHLKRRWDSYIFLPYSGWSYWMILP